MLFGPSLSDIEKEIENADSYQGFYDACLYHDEISGANEWKEKDASSSYDYEMIRKRVERMKTARAHQDAAALMSILHEGIHGNLGNISNPLLNKKAKIGTKKLIQEFLDEVCAALDFIYNADENEVDFYEKLSFFNETSHSYGQSCLMLSGGAGLGFFHVGVVRTLLAHDLIPKVVSGASAGSIIAALIGTRKKDELELLLTPESIHEQFSGWRQFQGIRQDSFFDSTNLENALIELFDLTTFEEAYRKTGISMTTTVSPADLHQHSRLLNHKTSPNAIITQAVRASCAIPYVFSPVYLKAKNLQGEIIPYIPNRQFADGSLMADLPYERLARLFGVNHSIVSQINPLAAPFIAGGKHKTDSISELTIRHATNLAKKNSIYFFDVLESMSKSDSLRRGIHKVRSIIEQQYVGDINILPKNRFKELKHVLANPTLETLTELINSAERACWPHIDLISRNTKISKTFRKHLNSLKKRESLLLSHHSYQYKTVGGESANDPIGESA